MMALARRAAAACAALGLLLSCRAGSEGEETERAGATLAVSAPPTTTVDAYAFTQQLGTVEATNRKHRATIRIGEGGLDWRSNDAGWTVGLGLRAFGRAGAVQATRSGAPIVRGSRVDLVHPSVVEIYENRPAGVQQRFEIASPPAGRGELVLEIALRGDVTPHLAADGGGIELRDDRGSKAALSGLRVTDAVGRELPARFTLENRTVAIHVDDVGAAYPISIDPLLWVQQAKLLAPASGQGDSLGIGVGIDGDIAVAGAPFHDAPTNDTGAAYAFVRTGTTWAFEQKLVALDAGTGDSLGFAVAVSGETIVAGASGDDDLAFNSGAAYVFTRSGGVWTQQQKLLPPGGAASISFGRAIAIDGDTVVVGAPNDSSAAPQAGAATVFVRSSGVWAVQQVLTASDPDSDDSFGWAVAIDGDKIAVGAFSENGPPNNRGAAYVFTRTGSVWTEQQKLLASDGAVDDRFGVAVDIDDSTIVVGAQYDDDGGSDSGAAYVFSYDGTTWTEQQKIVLAAPVAGDEFGNAVAVDGDSLLVAAHRRHGTIWSLAGVVYGYVRTGSTWTLHDPFEAGDAQQGDSFGWSVALDAGTAIIGARLDDENGTLNSGSAFIDVLVNTTATPCTQPSDCTNGLCVDGFCCDTACGAPCDSCSQLGLEGICSLRADGQPGAPPCTPYLCGGSSANCPSSCATNSDCTPGAYCRADGTCQPLEPNGTACSSGTVCATGNCIEGVCCNTSCGGACDSCALPATLGVCSPAAQGSPGAPSCAPYVCSGSSGTCPGLCADDDDCVATAYCNPSQACTPKKVNGLSCAAANECTSGACADGVCCTSDCSGGCDACNLPSSVGTCTLLPVGSAGAPSCAPYVCDGSAASCPVSCVASSDCAPNHYCSPLGTCLPQQGGGTSCSAPHQCATGLCVDDYCCDAACDEACDACNLAGTEGVCSIRSMGEIGTPSCAPYVCDGSAAPCPGSCVSDVDCSPDHFCDASQQCVPELAQGEPCTAPEQCSTGFCVDGTCCDTACDASCDACGDAGSVGTCTIVSAGAAGAPSCEPFVCDGQSPACPTACETKDDCSTGFFCDPAGACSFLYPLGELCDDASVCGSGYCVDGVCCDTACGASSGDDCQACSVDQGASADGFCDLLGAAHVCRSAESACDAEETCDGGLDCPKDSPLPNGSPCDDEDACTNPDQCVDGTCTPGAFTCGGEGGRAPEPEPEPEPDPEPEPEGCDCSLPGSPGDGRLVPPPAALAFLAWLAFLRRRRRPRGALVALQRGHANVRAEPGLPTSAIFHAWIGSGAKRSTRLDGRLPRRRLGRHSI
jgi:MYXO-CTERM domain-containing protein